MYVYKLTDQAGYTHNKTLWGMGVTQTAHEAGTDLCTASVIHVYEHPLLALLLNPIHANIRDPRLWKGEGVIVARDGLNAGVKTLTILEELPVPVRARVHIVAFGIYCARAVYQDATFVTWADHWLDGSERSVAAAEAAVTVAVAAKTAASYVTVADPATDPATAAVYAAVYAADAAVYAASAARYATNTATYAAYAAAAATFAAAYAAASERFDIVACMEQAWTVLA